MIKHIDTLQLVHRKILFVSLKTLSLLPKSLKFKEKWSNFTKKTINNIKRPNCALDRSTILCLFVPGFQRQVSNYVPKCRWIPQTKFQWIRHTYTCNVNFVSKFVLLWIPLQANLASRFGFRNCKWIPRNVSGIRKCKWIPQTVSGFRILFNTEFAYKQLKAELEFLSQAMRNLKAKTTIASGIHEQVSKHWLPKSVDVIF